MTNDTTTQYDAHLNGIEVMAASGTVFATVVVRGQAVAQTGYCQTQRSAERIARTMLARLLAGMPAR